MGQEVFGIPQAAISPASSFVLARGGQAYFYNYDAGLVARPFLRDVYKPFGFSFDAEYFLYLKANGNFPTFELHSRNLTNGTDRQIADTPVHHAAWSPAAPVLAYLWVDKAGRVHVSTYDMASGADAEIASGQVRADFLEWSADGSELMYMESAGTQRSFENGQFTYTVHRYSLRNKSEDKIAAADWAQFSGNELVVLSNRASLPYRTVPNPKGETIRRFVISGKQIYVELFESGRPTVKRWNARTAEFEAAHRGQIYLSTAGGVVLRSFSGLGPEYSYLPNDQPLPQPQDPLPPSATTFKIPFSGLASVVQGGGSYVDGSCDGALCFLAAHGGSLGYAIDWQQMTDQQQGNGHVLAAADGTVAVARTNVTCNTATPGCMVGWDDYNASCPDSNLGAGNFVVIAHLDGTYSLYAHLKSGSVQVSPGETVHQGSYLADQGHSGVAGAYNNYLSCGDHLHFSRQIGPGIWDQSVPTDFVETPCLLGCSTPYSSSNIELVAAPQLTAITPSTWTAGSAVQVTLTGQNFIYGSTVSVSNPSIAVSGAKILSATRLTAVLTIPAGTPEGPYFVTVSSSNGFSDAAGFSVVIPAPGSGALNASVTTPANTQQLTLQGTGDWAHWGHATVLSFNHKAGTASRISNFAPVGNGAPSRFTGGPVLYTWTDGTPVAAASSGPSAISVAGQNNGFQITAPADTTPRTLKAYVGVSGAQGQMRVGLSDGSAVDYIDSSLNNSGGVSAAVYTITYQAASPGQTLVVTYTQVTATGSINLQAATLEGSFAAPEFTLTVPPSVEVQAGTVDNHAVVVSGFNGFSGSTVLTATGMPPGVTADFSPATLSGAGSSTIAITVPVGTLPGTYSLTISATSGTVTRLANLNLVVIDFSLAITPATRSVIAGGSVTYTLIGAAPWGSPGSVSYSASGLPAGVSASFSLASAAFNSQVLMTLAAGGVSPGSYPITVTATIGTMSHSSPVTLVVTPAISGGSLTGSMATPSGTAQLTTAGTLDWAHWGLTAATDFNHKAVAIPLISNFTLVAGNLYRYANNSVGFTWTDGTPTASVNNSTTGVFTRGQGTGFSIVVPADPTVRVLKLYVGAFQAQGRIVARLSDGSAPDCADTSLINTAGVTTLGVYTFNYSAATSGQTLTVTYTQESATLGNVTLQAATLSSDPDFSVNALPAARTIVTGSSASYTINTTALAGFAGSIGFTLTGLPSGVTAGFSPATVTGTGSSTLTLTTTAAVVPGTYPLTIMGASGTLSHTTGVTLTVIPPATGGTLNGAMATPAATVQLTTEGTLDWAHWGLATATDFNHKAVTQQISNITMVGPTAAARYANNSTGYTWTDGTPTVSATNTTTGLYVPGQGKGFQITVPADTTPRTLKVYLGAWRTQGQLVAHLSDASAADYADTSLNNSAGVTTVGVYTLTYAAASAGQTLTVTYIQNTATNGNVAIQAATLSTAAPDFNVSANPSNQNIVASGSATYTVDVTAVNGFNGITGFVAGGLPAGVTASFNPTTVTGSGSSIMTLSSTAAVVPGNYPMTVTATSGSLVHTANFNLTITQVADFSIGVTPSSQSVAAGSSAAYTVNTAALNGFSASIGFAASGLPSGVTAFFSPPTVTGSGSTVMTLSTTVAAVPGSYPVTITATSGSLVHTANFNLTITQ
ncbi:MAG: M23 family metallopeptidase, partial [Candidatus Solibacter sp.]